MTEYQTNFHAVKCTAANVIIPLELIYSELLFYSIHITACCFPFRFISFDFLFWFSSLVFYFDP